jgi:hypothetical protein
MLPEQRGRTHLNHIPILAYGRPTNFSFKFRPMPLLLLVSVPELDPVAISNHIDVKNCSSPHHSRCSAHSSSLFWNTHPSFLLRCPGVHIPIVERVDFGCTCCAPS